MTDTITGAPTIGSPVGEARELRRVICWDRQQVTGTIATEAVSPSKAVFFATHTPLHIRQTGKDGVRSDTAGPEVGEDEVAIDFVTRDPVNGALLMPVIGESGTGKSHLVRWVKEWLEGRKSESDHRHVIYLPKSGTSLKSLLTNLLADRTDGSLAALRDQVASMTSGLDRPALEERLLNGMQEALVAAEPTSPEMRRLTGRGRLETLLLDPYVRKHLLQPGGVIPQLAASQLADRPAGTDDRPLEFTVDNLPLDLDDVRQAALATQKMLSALRVGHLQQLAVDLLNQALGSAVANAASLGSGRLSEALLQVRRQLAVEGKEIVLLVEDFALIQGVQRELLDAILEAGVRDGRKLYAPIRTLLAVTTGYYRNLVGTALTRAQAATPYVYDLDVQFDSSPAGLADVEGFVGRYLNAARLGRAVLDRAGDDPGAVVPNACDHCPLHTPCHAAFGASTDGHGLYPFNRPALHRAVLARAPEDRPGAFNPRAVIGEVIRGVLLEHASAITDGVFPDERFTKRFPTHSLDLPVLPTAVRAELGRLSPADAARRGTLLEFWGDAPDRVTNLDPAIHDAFGIAPLRLDDVPAPEPTTPSQPSTTTSNRPASTPPPALPRLTSASVRTAEIEDWSTRNRTLPAGVARDLRRMVRTAVVERILWLDPLMAEPAGSTVDKAWPARSSVVSIKGAESENDPRTSEAPIVFARSPENAEFLQGLLARRTTGVVVGHATRRLADIAERYRDALVQRVVAETEATDADLTAALRVALLGAALAGRAWPGQDEADLLAAALDDGAGWGRRDASLRVPAWRTAWDQHQANRPVMVERVRRAIGIARGTKVRMIDAVRAMRLLRAAAIEPWGLPAGPVPFWVRPAAAPVTGWDALVSAQFAELTAKSDAIRLAVPAGTASKSLLLRLREAFTAATSAGLLVGELPTIDDDLTAAETWAWDELRGLHDDVADARPTARELPSARAVVRAVVRDRGPDVTHIAGLLADARGWLDTAVAMADRDPRIADDVDHALDAVARRWAGIRASHP